MATTNALDLALWDQTGPRRRASGPSRVTDRRHPRAGVCEAVSQAELGFRYVEIIRALVSSARHDEARRLLEIALRHRPDDAQLQALATDPVVRSLPAPNAPGLWYAIQRFRSRTDLDELDVDEVYSNVRDRSTGRAVEL